MGAGQGLSLLRGDFGLPIFQYHELDDFTDAVVREANTMWDDWKGTAIYKTSNDTDDRRSGAPAIWGVK